MALDNCIELFGIVSALTPVQNRIEIFPHHLSGVIAAIIAREAIDIGIAPGLVTVAEQSKDRVIHPAGLGLLRPHRIKRLEGLVALADPVVMAVRRDLLPVVDAADRAPLAQHFELAFAREVVADIAIVDAAATVSGVGIAYQNRDRHRLTGPLVKCVSSLRTPKIT